MRHKKSFNHLGRKSAHRKAMLANMASSLVLHKRITTTTAKAKALRMYVEPLITKAKDDSTHSRRVVFSYLQNKDAVTELFREVGAKVAERPGGYTRILKTGSRLGDNADMCIIELVDYNENLLAAKSDDKKKSTRRRRGGKKSTTATAQTQTEEVKAEETPVEEEAKTEAVKEEKPKAEVKEEKKEAPKAEKEEAKKEEKKAETKSEEKKETKKEEEPKAEAKEEKKETPKKEAKSDEKKEE
ncbi:MAG: 50S ribosomal protein L17 [Bacteroidetes bacterium]|nr:50S ribosomal protein L17 [Bacteroidota bacterium]